jgi:hypothetical protein
MAKEYYVKKVEDQAMSGGDLWDAVPELSIDCYPWNENGYTPEVKAKVYYTNTHIHIQFKAYEEGIKAVYYKMNEPVYKDSCVEFFFNPDPEHDNRYFNFEINALGVPLIAIGPDRNGRMQITEESLGELQIYSLLNKDNINGFKGPCWSIEYTIPLSFIKKYYKNAQFSRGTKIKANFYKCGDETKFPHYGCWNPIVNSQPDFHRPEYFGTLNME